MTVRATQEVQDAAKGDLSSSGLLIDAFTIQSISDESGYVDLLGAQKLAVVEKDARMAKAAADQLASVREAEAEQIKIQAQRDVALKRAEAQVQTAAARRAPRRRDRAKGTPRGGTRKRRVATLAALVKSRSFCHHGEAAAAGRRRRFKRRRARSAHDAEAEEEPRPSDTGFGEDASAPRARRRQRRSRCARRVQAFNDAHH